jgi:hypothetical protein
MIWLAERPFPVSVVEAPGDTTFDHQGKRPDQVMFSLVTASSCLLIGSILILALGLPGALRFLTK